MADAVGVGDDVTYVLDGGESGIGGNESISPGRVCRRGQDRIERPEPRAFLEQAQAFTQVGLLHNEQRREQLDVVAGEFRRVFAIPAAGADVGELLDDLDGGGRDDLAVGYGAYQPSAWRPQWVVRPDGVGEDGGIQDDHAWRPRRSSSSAMRFPTSMGAAARIRRAAADRLRCVAGRPRSRASRITAATDVPRWRARVCTRW